MITKDQFKEYLLKSENIKIPGYNPQHNHIKFLQDKLLYILYFHDGLATLETQEGLKIDFDLNHPSVFKQFDAYLEKVTEARKKLNQERWRVP